jgi:hypothetical protein
MRPSSSGARTLKPDPAPPSAPTASIADFAHLVERALAILAEESEAWRARQPKNGSGEGSR